MQALDRRVNKKVKKIFDRSYKPYLNKKSNPPDCLENKEVYQAIQKEINEWMNPEDTKMSTEEKTEYEKQRAAMMDEDREKHEEDKVYQEEVNWLKYTPPIIMVVVIIKKASLQREIQKRNHC